MEIVLCCLLASMCSKCAIFFREGKKKEKQIFRLVAKGKTLPTASQLLKQVFLAVIDHNVASRLEPLKWRLLIAL